MMITPSTPAAKRHPFHSLSIIAASALIAPAGAVSAQTSDDVQQAATGTQSKTEGEVPSTDAPIIVTGRAEDGNARKELALLARKIIRAPRHGDPVGRFFAPICAVTLGVPEEFGEPILNRVRENARAAGLAVNNNPKCRGNLHVIFADQTEKFYSEEFWKDGPTLRHLISPERALVFGDNGPVKAWNRVQSRNPDGMPMMVGSTQYTPISGKSFSNNNQRSISRLKTATSSEILSAYVAFDLKAVQNMPLQQIADYATMRTLASTSRVSDPEGQAADTILTLFDEEFPPEGMTSFDKAMLESLYSSSLTIKPRQLFGRIGSKAIKKETAEVAN